MARELIPKFCKTLHENRIRRHSRRRTRIYHDIERRQSMQIAAERLSYDASNSISVHGVADEFGRDRQAEARVYTKILARN